MDPPGKIHHIFEAQRLQKLTGLHAAAPQLAVNHNFLVLEAFEFSETGLDHRERNQACGGDAGNVEFIRLTDIQEQKILISIHLFFQIGSGDLSDHGFGDQISAFQQDSVFMTKRVIQVAGYGCNDHLDHMPVEAQDMGHTP